MNQERQEIIFSVEGLSRTFGQKEVLRGITLGFYHGAKIGIIGRNGCGKSTLLRILAGEDDGHEGRVSRRKGIRVGTVAQEPRLDDTKNVRANIEEGLRPVRALLDEYEQVGASLGENLDEEAMERACERMAALQERIDQIEGWELERQIEQAMHALGCPPGDAQVSTLSGGEKRRIALCRALLSYPDILLLDEPTNHLDADTVAWLERHLSDYPGTVLLVTHDRYFLDNLVGWMLEIERGRAIPYQGNYSEYLARRTEALAREERAEATREKAVARELE
ncbi:MAG: ATP-binding cassette domain-containing protein, partial [Planctomycetota bacterium]